MKKLMNGLLIGLLVMVLMPVGAKAAGYKLDTTQGCVVTKCEATDTMCQSTCVINVVNEGAEIETITAKITPSNGVTIKSVTGAEVESVGTWTVTGNNTNPTFTMLSGKVPATVTKFPLAIVVTEYAKGSDCSISVGLGSEPQQTITIETKTEIVKTGAELPIAILACGAGLAAVIYLTVRKNTKLYKI